MEASALNANPALVGRSPLLRLQSDEKLIALIRRGHHGAFEALVQRYQPRLLAFCRHMLGSQQDAEDVLQEVFAAAFKAMCADDRPIHARPWLYRIARNRCLNHLRRPVAAGQDSMDVFERDSGTTTADTVHRREEFRQVVADVQRLPETQRTALLLREIDALSYDQIAEAMETTVPSVKSLLVRARVALAEAAEARLLTCAEVRLELGQAAEGIVKASAPVRRHVKTCERCRVFKRELRQTNKALAAVYPVGALVVLKKLFIGKLGAAKVSGASAGGSAAGTAGVAGGGSLAGGGATLAGGMAAAGGAVSAGGVVSAGLGALASKAAAGFAAAAIVTVGAVEVRNTTSSDAGQHAAPVQAQVAPQAKPVPAAEPAVKKEEPKAVKEETVAATPEPAPTPAPTQLAAAPEPAPTPAPATPEGAQPVDERSSTVELPADGGSTDPASPKKDKTGVREDTQGTSPPTPPPGEAETAPPAPPAPVVGE